MLVDVTLYEHLGIRREQTVVIRALVPADNAVRFPRIDLIGVILAHVLIHRFLLVKRPFAISAHVFPVDLDRVAARNVVIQLVVELESFGIANRTADLMVSDMFLQRIEIRHQHFASDAFVHVVEFLVADLHMVTHVEELIETLVATQTDDLDRRTDILFDMLTQFMLASPQMSQIDVMGFEALLADLTREHFFGNVSTAMGFHVGVLRESLIANVTAERFVAGVSSNVMLERAAVVRHV